MQKIEFVVKDFPTKKTQDPYKYYQTFKGKEKNSSQSTQPLQNIKGNKTFLNSLYEASITLIPKEDKDFTEKEFHRLQFFNNMLANFIQQYINNVSWSSGFNPSGKYSPGLYFMCFCFNEISSSNTIEGLMNFSLWPADKGEKSALEIVQAKNY